MLIPKRGNLPKVPACDACNNLKSELEHYLTATLPFGGRHAGASENLDMVKPRLARNVKLHRALAENYSKSQALGMVIPFEGQKLIALTSYIVKGLLWHHWKITVPAEYGVEVIIAMPWAAKIFDQIIDGVKDYRVSGNLGDGALIYEGMIAPDQRELSVWRLSYYGGALLCDDSASSDNAASYCYAFTGEKSFLERFFSL